MLETIALTVFFEGPFWVCVLERSDGKTLSAAKVTFGAEPKDAEVWEFICANFRNLGFSQPVAYEEREHSRSNPKRMRRKIEKAVNSVGVGTKSQQALKAQYELNKAAKATIRRSTPTDSYEQSKLLPERNIDGKRNKNQRKNHKKRTVGYTL